LALGLELSINHRTELFLGRLVVEILDGDLTFEGLPLVRAREGCCASLKEEAPGLVRGRTGTEKENDADSS
jgi:transcriptional regulator with AAA-type ATPase domain